MTGLNYQFDATQFQPDQGGAAHPVGKFPAFISNTEIKPTRDGSGGMFVVEFTTEAGKISNRYNLWNNSQDAVRIAHGQLSALCHATGVFRIDMNNEGAALRNGRCVIEVGKQKGESEYTEIKRVFDANGNEPGKSGAAPTPQGGGFSAPGGFSPQQTQQPAQGGGWGQPAEQPQPQGGAPAWGGNQPSQQPPQNSGGAPWGGGAPTQQAPQQPASGPAATGWQQGNAPAGAAPWGQR